MIVKNPVFPRTAMLPDKIENARRSLLAIGASQHDCSIEIRAGRLRVGVAVNAFVDDRKTLARRRSFGAFTTQEILAAEVDAAPGIEKFAIQVADDFLGHGAVDTAPGQAKRMQTIGEHTRMLIQKLLSMRLTPIGARRRAKISPFHGIVNLTLAHAVESPASLFEVPGLLGRVIEREQKCIHRRMNEFLTLPIAAVDAIGLGHDRVGHLGENLPMGAQRASGGAFGSMRRLPLSFLGAFGLVGQINVQQQIFEFLDRQIVGRGEQLTGGSKECNGRPAVEIVAQVDIGPGSIFDPERAEVGIQQRHIFPVRKRAFVHALAVAAPKR